MVKIPTKCSRLAGILLCICLSLARSALAEVRVEVNPRSGAINEQFVMSVIIESEDDAGVPQLSRSDDFNAVYIGPQSSVSIVNGHVSKSMAFSYRLVPRREGLLETPAIDIEVGSHSQHLDPVKVKVSAAQDVPADKINGVYLKQSIDPKTVYLGQQADNVVELQTAINLIDPQFADTSFDGFWSESIADNERSSRVSGGYQYDILRLQNLPA